MNTSEIVKNLTLEEIHSLISEHYPLNVPNDNGETFLHCFCREGTVNILQYLVQYHEASIHTKDYMNTNLVSYACRYGHHDVVQYLVQQGAHINEQDCSRKTALAYACEYGHIDIVKFLIEQGAQITINPHEGDIPIESFHEMGNPYNIYCKFDFSKEYQPLSLAIRGNHLDIVKFLVEHGADVNARNNKGQTPLDIAIAEKHEQIINYLTPIMKGKNMIDIYKAIRKGDLEELKKLMEQGIDVNAKDEDGETPLYYAAFGADLDIVKYLVEQGADVCVKDKQGDTPLHRAADSGYLDIVKYLVEKGADVNATDEEGDTPLHYAASKNHLDIVKYLVEKGADVNAKDEDGDTPLDWAIHFGHTDIIDYLTPLTEEDKE